MTKETWKPIPGYEGLYEASSLGRVRSLDRVVRGRGGCARRISGKVLTPQLNEKGYWTLVLWKNNKLKTWKISRVVALAFGVITADQEVDHEDRDKAHNAVSNLRASTRAGNVRNRAKGARNTSGYKGVSWAAHAKRWVAQITTDRKLKKLGYFDDPAEAHEAYKQAARALHKEFACFG